MPVAVYKPLSKTPYECVLAYRVKHNIPQHISISYAGRLDPMAEGVLLLLVGDENTQRRSFEHLSKSYEVTCLFGMSTDSGDVMGIPLIASQLSITSQQLTNHLSKYVGEFDQRYHVYSSRLVNGKPLFYWAKKGLIHTITIPTHRVNISDISLISESVIKLDDLIQAITRRVTEVSGDFRQQAIITAWSKFGQTKHTFPTFTLKVDCQRGGTYIRVLIEDIAHDLHKEAFTYRLIRTQVGDWNLESCVRLW